MYIEHPFFIDGKYYAKINDEMIEISKEVAYAMNNFRRRILPKYIETINDRGEVVERQLREIPYSNHSYDEVGYCDVEEEALASMCHEELQKAIGKLDEIEKVIIRGVYFEDMTQEAVGKILGITKYAVNKRLKRILIKMKNMLE